MLNDFHGNNDIAIDDMIADMIPNMELSLLSGNRQLLPSGIGETGYSDIAGCVDWSEHDAMAEMVTASLNAFGNFRPVA